MHATYISDFCICTITICFFRMKILEKSNVKAENSENLIDIIGFRFLMSFRRDKWKFRSRKIGKLKYVRWDVCNWYCSSWCQRWSFAISDRKIPEISLFGEFFIQYTEVSLQYGPRMDIMFISRQQRKLNACQQKLWQGSFFLSTSETTTTSCCVRKLFYPCIGAHLLSSSYQCRMCFTCVYY